MFAFNVQIPLILWTYSLISVQLSSFSKNAFLRDVLSTIVIAAKVISQPPTSFQLYTHDGFVR